ncbi:MAG: TRAP transporter large permease [Clostridia bacterium]
MTFLLIGTFVFLLLLKTPVAFSLVISCMVYMFGTGLSPIAAVQRMLAGPDSFPLLAIPGFVLAGVIMNTGGITQRIFAFAQKLVGHFTGGLGHANILASIIFAGMSGSAVADAAGLGAVELKAMKDAGFDDEFSLAITGASSVIGPIIPPSVPAVVFGVTAGVSIGRLFMGGLIPGLIMAGAMSMLVYFMAKKRNYPKEKRATFKELFSTLRYAFFPCLTPIIIIVGIFTGIITPTEASVIAVVYSAALGFIYKTIRIKDFYGFLKETLGTTVTVMFIIATASLFGWILAHAQIPQKLSELFITSVSNKYVMLFIINIIILFAGCFMEAAAAIMILTPVMLPVVISFGVDPVHFGIIMVINLMIGLMTPPVGMILYVLSSISKVPFERIAKEFVPYIIVLVIILQFITYIPEITLWLPNLLFNN